MNIPKILEIGMETPIRHVQQLTNADCGAACVSMVSGFPLEELNKRYDTSKGVGKRELCKALDELGIVYLIKRYNELDWGYVYIVTVASLNNPGGMHWIVVDYMGDRCILLDPLRGSRGKKWYGSIEYPRFTPADAIAISPRGTYWGGSLV